MEINDPNKSNQKKYREFHASKKFDPLELEKLIISIFQNILL